MKKKSENYVNYHNHYFLEWQHMQNYIWKNVNWSMCFMLDFEIDFQIIPLTLVIILKQFSGILLFYLRLEFKLIRESAWITCFLVLSITYSSKAVKHFFFLSFIALKMNWNKLTFSCILLHLFYTFIHFYIGFLFS